MFISVSVYFYVLESQLVSETKITERYTLHNYNGGEWRLHTLYTEVAHTMVWLREMFIHLGAKLSKRENMYAKGTSKQQRCLYVIQSLSLCVCAGEQ